MTSESWKLGVIGIVRNQKRRVLGTQKVGSTRAQGARQRELNVGGKAGRGPAFFGDERTDAGMKAGGVAAADGDRRGAAGGEVVVTAAVPRIVMRDRTDHGHEVHYLRQLWHMLAELDVGDVGWNGGEVAANFGGGVGLRIKCFVVAWAAV